MSAGQGTFGSPGRFFPPPFRLDGRTSCVEDDLSSRGSPGPSNWRERERSSSAAAEKHRTKRRKLCFTSELGPPKRWNPDGSENVEWARYQSTLRLKSKWDGIYEKFKDAHLLPQDEIFLGGRGRGEMRVLRDRGILRGLKREIDFGHFIELEEAAAEEERLLDETFDCVESDEDELGGWGDKSYLKTQYPEYGDAEEDSLEEDESEQEDDPELLEFLEAERRRREIMGEETDEEPYADEDDSVVDFNDPLWDVSRRQRAARSLSQSEEEEVPSDEESFSADVDELSDARGDSSDEMDLFNDDPDISAYDAEAIAALIREQNAALAAEGKMLVPDEQVDEVAYMLTAGASPSDASAPSRAAFASEQSSSSSGASPFTTPSKPSSSSASSTLNAGDSARPTPTPSQHSDVSSSSTKVGSDAGYIAGTSRKPWLAITASAADAAADEREQRTSPGRAVLALGASDGDSAADDAASDATLTPNRPLRKSALLEMQFEQLHNPFFERQPLAKAHCSASQLSPPVSAKCSAPRQLTLHTTAAVARHETPTMLPPASTVPMTQKRKQPASAAADARRPASRPRKSERPDLPTRYPPRKRARPPKRKVLSDVEEESDIGSARNDADAALESDSESAAPTCGGSGTCSKAFCMSCGGSRSSLSALMSL